MNYKISSYQRKDGRWEAQSYYGTDEITGKRKKITKYGATEKEAVGKVRDALAEIKNGTYVEPNKMTVSKWFKEWLEIYAKPNVKQSTYVNYRTHIESRIIPAIGNLKLQRLRVDILQKFFNEQAESGSLIKESEPLSPKTVRNLYTMMQTALQQAYLNELIPKKYIDSVKIPSAKQKEMRVLTRDEHKRLLSEIQRSEERYRAGILICLGTGIRVGELCGLRWEDFDEENKLLKIRRTLNRLPSMDKSKGKTEIVIDSPKSDKSIRNIPLPDYVIEFIKGHRERCAKEKIQAGTAYNDSNHIICNELGHYVEPRTIQDTFKRIAKAAGIENVSMHCLRHTFATRAVESDVDIKTLSVILGHADATITINRYAHALEEQKRLAMDKVSLFALENVTKS